MAGAVEILVNARDRATGVLRGIERGIANFGRAAMSVQGLLLGYGAGSLVASVIGSVAEAESTQTALATMLGDVERAKDLLGEVRQFGSETPFEFPELADATKKMLAFGFAADSVIPNLRMIGDVASGLNIPLGELAEIYGKARVQGRLFMEDINQLTGRGIPIIGELAQQFGVTEAEVRGLVESGQVGFEQLEAAFVSMTSEGGKFAGGMAAQSQTLKGIWSTLKDDASLLAIELGETLLPVIKEIVKAAIDATKNLRAMLDLGAGRDRFGDVLGEIAAMNPGQHLSREQLEAMRERVLELQDEMQAAEQDITRRAASSWNPLSHAALEAERGGVASAQDQLRGLRGILDRLLPTEVLQAQAMARAQPAASSSGPAGPEASAVLDASKGLLAGLMQPIADTITSAAQLSGGALWGAANLDVAELLARLGGQDRESQGPPAELRAVESRLLTRGSGSKPPEERTAAGVEQLAKHLAKQQPLLARMANTLAEIARSGPTVILEGA